MSPTPAPVPPLKWKPADVDRCSHRRYPITGQIEYQPLSHNDGEKKRRGTGKTFNISTGGISFSTEEGLRKPCKDSDGLAFSVRKCVSVDVGAQGRVARCDGKTVCVSKNAFRIT